MFRYMFPIFVFTHSNNKPMMIELAWGQFVFSSLLYGGNHKISIGKRFGHRCGPSSVPDFLKPLEVSEMPQNLKP